MDDVQYEVGQDYDGAGNVWGKCHGLKTKIQEINPKAGMVLRGHRFNLVIETTAVCCPEVSNVLGLLNKLYVFFSGHKRNSTFLEAHADRPVTRSNWCALCACNSDYDDSVLYGSILHALGLMVSTGAEHATVSGAHGLTVRLKDIRFIITLFVLKEILAVAGPAARQL